MGAREREEARFERDEGIDNAFRVLLVEDDEDDAVFVADLLEGRSDFELEVVPTLAAAMTGLTARRSHCVLLDLNLPDAVGLDGLERLLAVDADAAIVVLTGDPDGRLGGAAVAAGAQDFLVKGRIDTNSLIRGIRYAIERRSSEHWRREVAVARAQEAENARLQRGLLPAPILDDDTVMLSTAYRPDRRRQLLGGDFYDVVETSDGVVHIMIGDVCGHGPDEAALGVRLRMAWRTLVLAGGSRDGLLPTLDRVLEHERDDDGVFATLVYVTLDAARVSATVRLAGHPPPVLLRPGTTALLLDHCESGPVLGLGWPSGWPATDTPLDGEWTLVCFTDGLFEGRIGPGPQRLGIDGLVDLLGRRASSYDDAALHELITDVELLHGGALSDDVAILAVRVGPQDMTGAGSCTSSSQ
jgi:serine phosphatase RsbU (regulator of sigma subunit)